MLHATAAKFYEDSGKYGHLPDTENILKGFVYCKHCDRALKRMRNISFNRNYITHTYVCRYCDGVISEEAGRKRIRESELLEAIAAVVRKQIEVCADLEQVIECAGLFGRNSENRRAAEAETVRCGKEIACIGNRLKTLYMDKCAGLFDDMEYARMKKSYEADKEAFSSRLTELTTEQEYLSSMEPLNNSCITAFHPFYGETELTMEMLAALMTRIDVISDRQLEITFQYKDEYKLLIAAADENKAALVQKVGVMAV